MEPGNKHQINRVQETIPTVSARAAPQMRNKQATACLHWFGKARARSQRVGDTLRTKTRTHALSKWEWRDLVWRLRQLITALAASHLWKGNGMETLYLEDSYLPLGLQHASLPERPALDAFPPRGLFSLALFHSVWIFILCLLNKYTISGMYPHIFAQFKVYLSKYELAIEHRYS